MPQNIERVRPTKVAACSHDTWHSLLLIYNSKPTYVLVRKEQLTEVVQCHHRHTHENFRFTSLQEKGRKFYSLDRTELGSFIQSHGKVCGHAV